MNSPRSAIVTGAGKRVGSEIATALAEDGWQVIAHVHHEGDQVPPGCTKVVADLAEIDCAELIFSAAAGLPPVRLLVNNAARFAHDEMGSFDPAEFDAHMFVNVRGPALLTERFATAQDGSEDSLIVNILDAKLAAPNPDFLSYTLSKQGLTALTELSARALSAKAIRVNAVAPALMLQSSGQSEENFRTMHADNPLRRGVEAADVIGAIRYFLEARSVTGQVLVIDSGHRFLSLPRDVQFLGDS